jgi:hypothetical protein
MHFRGARVHVPVRPERLANQANSGANLTTSKTMGDPDVIH